MVENPIAGSKFRLFSSHRPLQYFHIQVISLAVCLGLWNEFKVRNTLDMEESDER
jgi:hypothetical protein